MKSKQLIGMGFAVSAMFSLGFDAVLWAETIYFQIPIAVEEVPYGTALALGIETKNVDKELADITDDDRRWALPVHETITALKNGNLKTYQELVASGDSSAASQAKDRAEEFESLESVYRNADSTWVHRLLNIGEVRILDLTLRGSGGGEERTAPFTFVERKGDCFPTVDFFGHPLVQAVSSALKVLHREQSFSVSPTPTGTIKIQLPGIESTSSDVSVASVALVFNGFKPAWGASIFKDGSAIEAGTKSRSPEDLLIEFYRSTLFTYASIQPHPGYARSPEASAFADRFSDRSREKLLEGFATTPVDEFTDYLRLTTANRTIRYVMSLDPIYLVFYSMSTNENYSMLLYDYVIRDSEGKYLMTNLGFRSTMDNLLHWEPVESQLLSLINSH